MEADGGGVSDKKAAKPLTTVRDSVSCMTPLDVLKKTSGHFPALFVGCLG